MSALALATVLSASGGAWAQTGKIVVPYPAGGPTDVIARTMAEQLGKHLGHSFIVENVVGAGGTLAPGRVARAEPDGMTILIQNISFAAAPALYDNLSYDTINSFEPVGLINRSPLVLVGRRDLPASTPQELVAWIKQGREKVNFGHGGVGTSGHFCLAILANALGIEPTFIAYRGSGPALNDLVGRQIDLLCDQTTNSVPQITSGTIKAYGVTAPARLPSLPDVPTTSQIGLPDVQFTVWHGLFVPKGTPSAIVYRLNAALRQSLEEPAVIARFEQLGADVVSPADRAPEALAKTLKTDIDRLGQIAQRSKMKAETQK